MSKIKTKRKHYYPTSSSIVKVKGNVYEAELEECKKQIEISLDYFNSTKKHHKRNAIKPNSLSAKYKSNNTRSRNLKKNGLFTKSTGKSDYHLNTNNTRKNSKVYMKLTGGKPKKVGPDNKENNSKNANKNPLRLNRKSYGGKVALQSNLSSTGAYNSITKQSEVSSGSNSYAPSRKQKNYSTRDKPIYQISETGGSVQNFSKLSPTLRKSSDTSGVSPVLSGDSQSKFSREDPTRNCEDQQKSSTKVIPTEMKKETVLVEEMTVNNSESVSSNISDTAVSEGSLIVQNLPTSKILYATRKNNTQIPVMGLSKRRDYTIKEQASCKEENKYEYHYAEQAIEAECSDFSENSNGAIEVEIEYTEELETKKNKRRGNSSKAHIPTSIPDTSKSAMASSKRFGANFASTRNKFKFDAQKKRKSQGYGQDFIKKKSKEHKILNYKLRHAVEKGDLKTIKEIIETDQKSADRLIDLNMKSQDQWTLLHYATSEGNYGIVKYLLDKGADPNTQASNQRTALHIACMRGHLSIVNILLKCNANINMTDMDGNTAVHLCSEFGHHDLLRFLLAKRPSLHIINNYDNSPVDVAADEEILYIFDQHITSVKKELIQNVAEINGLPQVKEAGSMTQRTKLVKIQDSLVCPSEESIEAKVEDRDALTSNCNKNDNKALFPYIQAHKSHNSNLNFLNAQNFHPEMTETYKFKEGRLKLDDLESYSSIISKEEPQEKIGTHSFVPLMILGKGSFGEVYLVQKHNDKRFYAMKVLQKDKLMGQNLVKYARTERNVLSYTKHPFIVGLNYAFQTKEKLFLLLDYCPGGDLGRVLAKEKRLPESRAKIYLAEVLLALEDLHRRDIIFRDLKPDNVVLDSEGHALLTDFGLSKEGVQDNKGARSFCGSVAYLAPEMLKRSGHGKSVDWYLLGVLLYEMLVGVPPYFAQDKEEMFYNIQKGHLKIPSDLSIDAKSLLVRLLNRNPHKRLGASTLGAEDIKTHAFFKEIDWNEALERKLNPPKPTIMPIVITDISQSIFEDSEGHDDDHKVPGWSFAN